ncbi:MAG: tetratricopeptide repeat protein [Novosphingobium sp.]|nr:tetratricopeptide repeat protein [Novosphingobium sp.]
MTRHRQSHAALRNAITTAVAATLLAGCAGNHLSKVNASSARAEARAESASERGIDRSEQAVAKDPRNAVTRVALADAYLQAGRFDSAATTYNDAMSLGDSSPRTALSLALAHIGGGRDREAVAVLDEWRDSIPAGDLGLALALAGETSRGVGILSEALRAGQNSPKLRQNLAYAYALDGRWKEARLMVAQDVPADRIDSRISAWAMMGKPEDYQKRVAGLLGVPVSGDSGQPAYLALSDTPAYGAATAQAEPQFVPQVAAAGNGAELPALGAAPATWSTPVASPAEVREPVAPVAAAAPVAATAPVADNSATQFDDAFAAPKYVSKPVVQHATAKTSALEPKETPVSRAIGKLSRASVPAKLAAEDCTHLVQLGSFTSEKRARMAWDIYRSEHPELKDHELAITPAVVRGRKYWRVAAAGFDKTSAANMCSSVKGRGGGCIAYAETRPLPGALPGMATSGVRRARR